MELQPYKNTKKKFMLHTFDAELCLLADMVLAWENDGYVFQTNLVQCFLHIDKHIAYFL